MTDLLTWLAAEVVTTLIVIPAVSGTLVVTPTLAPTTATAPVTAATVYFPTTVTVEKK
jgi:hypothetical protein